MDIIGNLKMQLIIKRCLKSVGQQSILRLNSIYSKWYKVCVF
jgi:hypothetical protein